MSATKTTTAKIIAAELKASFKTIKSFLLEQKALILNKSNAFKTEQSSERVTLSDEAEVASLDLSLHISINLHERDRMVLFQIETALAKLENGTYGECVSCGEPIGHKRLQARPFATLCIHCKEEQEDPRNYIN